MVRDFVNRIFGETWTQSVLINKENLFYDLAYFDDSFLLGDGFQIKFLTNTWVFF